MLPWFYKYAEFLVQNVFSTCLSGKCLLGPLPLLWHPVLSFLISWQPLKGQTSTGEATVGASSHLTYMGCARTLIKLRFYYYTTSWSRLPRYTFSKVSLPGKNLSTVRH